MTCEWRGKLDRYVDSELSGVELTELEAHLKACAECAADALGRLQLKRMTQAAGRRFSPRPEFRLKVEQSVAPAEFRRWSVWPAFAAAAAVLVTIVSASAWLQHSRNEQALDELADLHVSTLASANPVDVVSTDRHTVKPWFQGKLPFTFNLPEMEGSPYKLLGGRVTYFQQNPGAHLLFEAGKHRISVFIFQNRGELSGLNSGGFNSETWTAGTLRYFLIGDARSSDIRALGQLLRSAAN